LNLLFGDDSDLDGSTKNLKPVFTFNISTRQIFIIEVLIHQIPISDLIEILLYVLGSILSVILVKLSVSAYLKSGLKRLRYAIFAFSLFCGFLIYENLEHLFSIDNPFTDIIIPSTGLAILVFFFLAVIKRD
jgi:hypothetical protein